MNVSSTLKLFSSVGVLVFALAACGGDDDTVDPGDQTGPTLEWIVPGAGATVSGLTPLTVEATDASGIDRVEFYAGSTRIGTDTEAEDDTFRVDWDTTTSADGTITLRAVAFDEAGNEADASLDVTVLNQTAGTTELSEAAAQDLVR